MASETRTVIVPYTCEIDPVVGLTWVPDLPDRHITPSKVITEIGEEAGVLHDAENKPTGKFLMVVHADISVLDAFDTVEMPDRSLMSAGTLAKELAAITKVNERVVG